MSFSRKNILLLLLALVVCFFMWQIYVTIGHKGFSKHKLNGKDTTAIDAFEKKINTHPHEKQAQDGSKQTANEIVINPTQREYLRLMSEYQLAQVKRLIAKDYEQIAISNWNAAKAMEEIEKLSHVKGVSNLPNPTPVDYTYQDKLLQQYRLVYTGQQYGKWFATLRYQNKLIDLEVGNTTPDGAKVMAISQHAVTTQLGQKIRTIGFYSVEEESLPPHAPVHTAKMAEKTNNTKVVAATVQAHQPQQATSEHNTEIPKSQEKSAQEKIAQVKPVISHAPVASHPQQQLAMARLATSSVAPTTAHATLPMTKSVTPVVDNHHPVKAKVASSPQFEIKRQTHTVTHQATINKPVAQRHLSALEEALLQVQSDVYAIQLMGNANLNEVRAFLANHKLQSTAIYYKTYRNGHPWYVILYKQHYPNPQLALAGVRDLPIELQRWSPFVKSFDQVHTEIQKVG